MTLREVRDDDIAIFVAHQRDAEARRMAAFTSEGPGDVEAELARWVRIRAADNVLLRTVLVDDQVAGHVSAFDMDGEREVTYWLGREWWGRGVATESLRLLLELEPVRPLHARVAEDNVASISVLKRCGFQVVGTEHSYAAGRGHEIDELLLRLDA